MANNTSIIGSERRKRKHTPFRGDSSSNKQNNMANNEEHHDEEGIVGPSASTSKISNQTNVKPATASTSSADVADNNVNSWVDIDLEAPPSDLSTKSDEKVATSQGSSGNSENEEVLTCCICFDTIKEQGVLNSCPHAFCLDCISTWAKSSNVCPVCRVRYRTITPKDLTSNNNEAAEAPSTTRKKGKETKKRKGQQQARSSKKSSKKPKVIRVPRRDFRSDVPPEEYYGYMEDMWDTDEEDEYYDLEGDGAFFDITDDLDFDFDEFDDYDEDSFIESALYDSDSDSDYDYDCHIVETLSGDEGEDLGDEDIQHLPEPSSSSSLPLSAFSSASTSRINNTRTITKTTTTRSRASDNRPTFTTTTTVTIIQRVPRQTQRHRRRRIPRRHRLQQQQRTHASDNEVIILTDDEDNSNSNNNTDGETDESAAASADADVIVLD